jgi:phosphoenolpyruvate carboxykinase (GTP)
VLAWIIDRLEGTAGGTETAIGVVPSPADLDLDGLDATTEQVAESLKVEPEQWQAECKGIRAHFQDFGTHLPPALSEELDALEQRLADTP